MTAMDDNDQPEMTGIELDSPRRPDTIRSAGGAVSNMYAEMLALLDQLPPPETVVARVECGEFAAITMRLLPRAERKPWEPAAPLFAVPVVINRDLPLWAWRALNSDGDVLQEGEIGQPTGGATP